MDATNDKSHTSITADDTTVEVTNDNTTADSTNDKTAIDVLCAFFGCSVDNLQQKLRDKESKNKAVNELKKYSFKPSYLKTDFVVKPKGLSYTGADLLKVRRGSLFTVAVYLLLKEKITLKHPELLCVLSKSGKGFYYQFPLELLRLVESESSNPL